MPSEAGPHGPPAAAPPPPAARPPDEGWRRLHGTSLVFRVGRHVRALVVPAVLVVILARERSWEIWLLAMFVPSVLFELIRYLTLRYRFTDDELVIRQGLVFRNERHIRFHRIQNIDLVQNPFQRLLGVADVRIETAGGSEPEAKLQVLSMDAVTTMRRCVFAGRTAAAEPAVAAADVATAAGPGGEAEPATAVEPGAGGEPGTGSGARELLRIPALELVKLGLVSNRGMVFVAIAAGLAWEFDLYERLEYEALFESVSSQQPLVIGTMAVASLVAALLLLRVLSVAWVLLRFHGYVLRREGDDLQISCGLLTRASATVPRHRVQFISVHEPLLARWMKRASIRIETAGGIGEREHETAISRRWFVPILPRDQVGRIVRELFPALELENVSWQPLAPRAPARMARRNVIVALLLTLGCTLLVRPWGVAAAALLLPAALWHARASARRIAWARIPGGMLYRSGVVTWKLGATFDGKMQVLSMGISPFDRRYGMASLHVDTAGAGPAEHAIAIRYLPRDVARDQLDDLARHARDTTFRT